MPIQINRLMEALPQGVGLREIPQYLRICLIKLRNRDDLPVTYTEFCKRLSDHILNINTYDLKSVLGPIKYGPNSCLSPEKTKELVDHLFWYEMVMLGLALNASAIELLLYIKHKQEYSLDCPTTDITYLFDELKKVLLKLEDPDLLRHVERLELDWISAKNICKVQKELWVESESPVLCLSAGLNSLSQDVYGARLIAQGLEAQDEEISEWVMSMYNELIEDNTESLFGL